MTNKRLQLGLVRFSSPQFQRMLYTAEDLVAYQLRRCHKPYVAFSGGKDSLAVLALVHKIRPQVHFEWHDAELEYPETVEMMRVLKDAAGEQMIVMQSTSTHGGWFRSWGQQPYFREPIPGTIATGGEEHTRFYMQQQGFDMCFLGTRGEENARRRNHFLRSGSTYWCKTGRRCCPIAGWSSDDVWALIAGWHLPYNRAYDVFDRQRIADVRWRIGPLPLAPRATLELGWPDLLERLETYYQRKWSN